MNLDLDLDLDMDLNLELELDLELNPDRECDHLGNLRKVRKMRTFSKRYIN